MKGITFALVLSLFVAGCSAMNPLTPTVGWTFQIGTPSQVHIPVIATQSGGDVSITNLGTHVPQEQAAQQDGKVKNPALAMPMPRLVKPTGDCADPCK